MSPGYYFVDVFNVHVEGIEVGYNISHLSSLTKVLIQFPQGAMEKTIEVNRSQTREEVTITLEKLELSASGAKVYALAQIPNYTSPSKVIPLEIPTPEPTPPLDIYPSPAWYRLDNGIKREIGSPGFMWADKGFRLTWDLIDPVPSDAKEITFAITNFGKWAGPWEYRIILNLN